ncbi:CPCC family cysteine-rich protein [Clostridium frigidicarnis]|uniref:Cysteine-rich CPCC n=1 Tax=Clostridium frigidicarnis TaxID=84698 RepID=A0A1I1A011_9CLOT|nr:CPCC family cysteine-rich protein [Clostridium frigidicarnis]SFB31147.1 Cysteine-rich CPCC [Clostridium frigidicarnis]
MKPCPCCGYKTLEDNSIYDICETCFWEDHIVQFNDPDYEGGANTTSLRQAQLHFIKFGACD